MQAYTHTPTQPCMHTQFTHRCEPGWEGKYCDQRVDICAYLDPCREKEVNVRLVHDQTICTCELIVHALSAHTSAIVLLFCSFQLSEVLLTHSLVPALFSQTHLYSPPNRHPTPRSSSLICPHTLLPLTHTLVSQHPPLLHSLTLPFTHPTLPPSLV